MNTQSATITAVCHVRSPLLLDPVDEQVDTVRACESEGTIDDLLLRSWPKEVGLDEGSPYHEVLEAYERFQTWADQQGVDIHPPFKEQTTTSQVTGGMNTRLVTPLFCLELYADEELVGVYPHSVGDETITTSDAIETLRCGEVPTPLGGDVTVDDPQTAGLNSTHSREDACPDCGSAVLNGQGLFTCTDCEWTGIVADTGEYVTTATQSTERRDASVVGHTQ